jgi:hypothetical protein
MSILQCGKETTHPAAGPPLVPVRGVETPALGLATPDAAAGPEAMRAPDDVGSGWLAPGESVSESPADDAGGRSPVEGVVGGGFGTGDRGLSGMYATSMPLH